MFAGADENRPGFDREVFKALVVDVAAVMYECDTFTIDRHINVVITLAPTGHESHRERVLAIGRERVQRADPTAGAVRRTLDTFPFVL